MAQNILQKGINVLLKRQANILSAAFIIMLTVILSQILGIFRQRLLVSIFDPSTLGLYNYAQLLPDSIFQLTIAAALSSAFIPVFSEYIHKGQIEEGHKVSSTLIIIGLAIFSIISIILAIFAPFFLNLFNGGGQFSQEQMDQMATMMRIIVLGQLPFIVGTFLTAILQSYNHFFIPGVAAALYNLGIILGVYYLSERMGIYAAPIGTILGSFIFIIVQLPVMKRVRFSFVPSIKYAWSDGVKKILKLTWPRTISIVVYQIGTLSIAALVAYLNDPARLIVIYDYARTLAWAPVNLFGQSIAQAAFPILSREKNNLADFKATFLSSLNQMLYLILPISALVLVLRIPIVRLVFGADKFDWDATVLTGRTLAYMAISIFASAILALVTRAFYALQNTFLPFIVGLISTLFMIITAWTFVFIYNSGLHSLVYPYSLMGGTITGEFVLSFGIEGIGLAFSLGTLLNLLVLLFILKKKLGGFNDSDFYIPLTKIFSASFLTAIALYIPLKLLDQLVFDTSRTIGLITLTGISTAIGLSLYLFLTWLFNVKEAQQYVQMFKKIGNWREILGISDEVIDPNRTNHP